MGIRGISWERIGVERVTIHGKLGNIHGFGAGGGVVLRPESGRTDAPCGSPTRSLASPAIAPNLRSALADDPLAAALLLLGSDLVLGDCRARLVEVEVYLGSEDPGSHAFRGQGKRNRTMFGPPGHAYVYFTYGNHWMLNVVAREHGIPAAILIRAARPLTGIDSMRQRRGTSIDDRGLLSGPGKLCQAFGITREHDGLDLLGGAGFRLEPGETVENVLCGPRIGLATGKGDDFPWRFVDAEHLAWVSAGRSRLTSISTTPAGPKPTPTDR
ncbi:MAG: putative 3-methyladenine DNA glycosylase [Fimbriimonadaceae bacterium]|nr:putative 3-methyladenine DNA glycosylase [Fimbriimonadaceae bacterium]